MHACIYSLICAKVSWPCVQYNCESQQLMLQGLLDNFQHNSQGCQGLVSRNQTLKEGLENFTVQPCTNNRGALSS